jgi:hypothetical protein
MLFLHFYPEDAGNIFFWNAVELLPNYTALYPRIKCSL